MTDLVVISLEAWDHVWRRNQHLVAGLLARDERSRVLFVEPARDPVHDLRRRMRTGLGAGLRLAPHSPEGAAGRLWLYQPTKPLPRKVDPRADCRLANAIIRAARTCGMTEPVLWVNDPLGATVLDVTGWPTVYDITDDWLRADRPGAELRRIGDYEERLLSRAGRVVVCSPTLAATKAAAAGVTIIPNAVDATAYEGRPPRPAHLPAGPVALYAGTIHADRIDVDLCIATARLLAEGNDSTASGRRLVLLGPVAVEPDDRDRLTAAGVVLLGSKPAGEVPAYLRWADLLVVPHVVTAFTESLDPIKRYEYHAAGVPVVSTPVAGFVDGDNPRVEVATMAEFPNQVRAALATARVEPSVVDLDVPTWATRVEQFAAVLDAVRPTVPHVSGRSYAGGRPAVAIAHDFLTQRGGAERVALTLTKIFPDAPLYTLIYDPTATYPEFGQVEVHTSFLDRVGWLRSRHRWAFPILPLACAGLRPQADVIVASSAGYAHAFAGSGRRVVYCHNPARWLYQQDDYFEDTPRTNPVRLAVTAMSGALRWWDRRAARRADVYLANSRVVRDRIRTAYGREAVVVPAPVALATTGTRAPVPKLGEWADQGYLLVVSRLLPYKHVDVAVDALRLLPEHRLVVVGDGPLRAKVEASLPGNVRLLRGLSDAQLRTVYAGCSLLLAPSHEDYGLTPLEAAAFGKPTVALRAGGYLDTVVDGHTGVFFDDLTAGALAEAITRAEAMPWSTEQIAAHAATFGEDVFAATLRRLVGWEPDDL